VVRFAEPARLWLLALPLAAAAGSWLRHRRRVAVQQRLASPSVWRQVMGGVPATGLGRLLAWCGAAALVVIALARPQWGQLPRQTEIRTRDVVFALDVSDSMRCQDVRPSRLARGLEILRRALPGLDGNRVGVVTFAGDAYPLVPLTTDLDAVGTFLEGVEPGTIALPGSNLERAVGAALELLPGEGTGRVVVLVTDGENLQGDLEAAGRRLREAGVRAVGLLVGTAGGGPIPMPGRDGGVHYKRDRAGQVVITHADRRSLAHLAGATGGSVLAGAAGDEARELVKTIAALQTRAAGRERSLRRVERFPIFLAAAAAFLALGFLLPPWRRLAAALVVGLCLVSAPAAAAPGTAPVKSAGRAAAPHAVVPWWQRWIPGGSRRLARAGLARWRSHDVKGAAKDFAGAAALDPQNPARWFDLGTALAAGGDLRRAAPLLEKASRSGVFGAAYNLGTAALEQGRAAPAVRFLRRALLRRPDDPRVKRNYELALKLLEKQRQKKRRRPQQKQDQRSEKKKNERRASEKKRAQAAPTPTPAPRPARGRRQPANPLFSALERAEAQARAAMRRPTPRAVTVEKDW